ncbi:hypothetical protein LJK87_01085 [Paenibacillus sp. P25]|nr:hypothetical protein LJK87_01085 [Paenibacillus sp. P25]
MQVTWGGKPANPQTSGYRIWAIQNGVKYGPVTVPPTATSGYVGGLTNGVPAQIYVAGVNAQGVGTVCGFSLGHPCFGCSGSLLAALASN